MLSFHEALSVGRKAICSAYLYAFFNRTLRDEVLLNFIYGAIFLLYIVVLSYFYFFINKIILYTCTYTP